jgi:hypothetical protein
MLSGSAFGSTGLEHQEWQGSVDQLASWGTIQLPILATNALEHLLDPCLGEALLLPHEHLVDVVQMALQAIEK